MADPRPGAAPAAALLYLRDDEVLRGIEALTFGWRDFSAAADRELADAGLGRAHHRVLHLVARKPGLPAGELAALLKVTKQSLGRVMKDLQAKGLIAERQGESDRRQRLLSLTAAGQALQKTLFAAQRQVIAQAFRDAGPDAVAGFRRVLAGLVAEDERARIYSFINRPAP